VTRIKGYRITSKEYKSTAFSGEGARLHGGRWNSKGSKAVYLADSPALATLEILVHLNDQEELDNFDLYEVLFDEDQVITLASDDLPSNWSEAPVPNSTVKMGDAWIRSNKSALLKVPTVTIRAQGWNYIFNVSHPDADDIISTAQLLPYEPDNRLAK